MHRRESARSKRRGITSLRINSSFQPTIERLESRDLLADCTGITDIVNYKQFEQVPIESVECLSAQQLATIPDRHWFARMSDDARAALTANQVQSLLVDQVGIQGLTPRQISELTTGQIQSLDQSQLRFLNPSQIHLLTRSQLASIPTDWWFRRLSLASRASLTRQQIPYLNLESVNIRSLPAEKLEFLSLEQVRQLSYREFGFLSASQSPWLSTDQLASIPSDRAFVRLTADARAALSSNQIQSLNVSAIGLSSFTESQLAHLSVAQIQSLHLRDFRYLSATQVPELTEAQIRSISSDWWFTRMSDQARASLTVEQIRALDVSVLGIRRLSGAQVRALSAAQISSLQYSDFPRLNSPQILHLTQAQMSTIPNTNWFARIPDLARAALTAEQVRALDIANVGIGGLTERQIAYLSTNPITSVNYREFEHLEPAQIPQLTPSQIATIPNARWFARISPEARAMLTAQQIQAMDVSAVGIRGLTARQVSLLRPEQVQRLLLPDFRYLTPRTVTQLTSEQISSIPTRWWFTRMSDHVRAQLLAEQVQALRVGELGIKDLTAGQISYLTPAQVQSLAFTQFQYLTEKQTPWLSPDQLSGIDRQTWFTSMSASARTALSADQVRALNVAIIPISALTSAQQDTLSVEQIQSLDSRYFYDLNPNQIKNLTDTQVRAIPNTGSFSRIPDDVRAQLTNPQVQQLTVSQVSISRLTPRQRASLTPAQIQTVPASDLRFLSASQAQHVTPEQLSSIDQRWYFRTIPADVRAAFRRDQLLALDESMMAELVGLPASFGVSEMDHATHQQQHVFHPQDASKQHEHSAALALVPRADAEFVSARTGSWSDPATWQSHSVPSKGSKVLVQHGHAVTLDAIVTTDQAIETLRIDGLLQFAHDIDTQLSVDTIVVDPGGQLEIGTDEQPIDDDVVARVVFVADTAIDRTWDPNQLSRGLISHGRVEMHGEEVTPYMALQVDPQQGATQLVLESEPVNWQVGDRLILTGVYANYSLNQDEELDILAIDGNRVTIDADADMLGQQPLAYSHLTPDGDDGPNNADPANLSPNGDRLKVYVANVSRNVVVTSENPDINEHRGHVMFMHHQDVEIDNVGFYGLGRTDKRNPINDPQFDEFGQWIEGTGRNPRGRYSVHFHRAGTSYADNPGSVTGSAIVDSPGWGLVNHESYVHAHNNVAFHVVGASFVTESGNEIGSYDGNLSINNSGSGDDLRSRREIFDFGHGGHGFWAQGPLVEFDNNIAAGSRETAFVFFTQSSRVRIDADLLFDPTLAAGQESVPVGTVSFNSIENNTAFASKRGLETWFHQTHMNDGQSYIDDFTAWRNQHGGISTPYTGRTTIRRATLVGNIADPRSTAIGRNHATNQMTYDSITALGYSVGISIPVNRDTIVRDGRFAAVHALEIDRARDSIREVDIVGYIQFESLSESQLRDREQFDVYMNGGFQMENFDLETLFSPDITRLGTIRYNDHQVFYHEQATDYVPFRADVVPDFVPYELVGLTNAELHDQFGVAFAGALAAPEAYPHPRINGLVGPRVEYPESLKLLSSKFTNQLKDYHLVYEDAGGNSVHETIELRSGWNLVTREIGGATRTLFVFGDVEAPTFDLRETAVVNPDGLGFDFTVRGNVLDNSTGRKAFQRKFDNLNELPVVEADGQQYLELTFEVDDLAGNVTPVVVHILLDPDAPLVPATGQEDLPDRLLPMTLDELLQFYIIA